MLSDNGLPTKEYLNQWKGENRLYYIVLVMARLYSLKCHSLGPQARSDVAEVFPTRATWALYQTLGED
jgi:hypothetical protein